MGKRLVNPHGSFQGERLPKEKQQRRSRPDQPNRHREGKRRKTIDKASELTLLTQDCLAYLTSQDADNFLKVIWEKQPAVFKGSTGRRALFGQLCDQKSIFSLLDDTELDLAFGRDLVAARYQHGKRETLSRDQPATSEEAGRLFNKEGCTLQFHQPQRRSDDLWRLVAALEAQLGCLVGINAYCTPAGTQGLAPHHDDVEIFVCQTEGSKKWRIYGPHNQYPLPATSSRDFRPDEIGKPVMEVMLEVGDVLYMPRGTVHEAKSQEGASTHLTVSTYQAWSCGHLAKAFLEHAVTAVDGSLCPLPLQLRQGLRPGLLWDLAPHQSGSACGAKARQATQQLSQGLRELADALEKRPERLASAAACSGMALDFFRWRAPPHPHQLPPQGQAPSRKSSVFSRGRECFHVLVRDAPADVPACQSQDAPCCANGATVTDGNGVACQAMMAHQKAADQKIVVVLTNLFNDISQHMMAPAMPMGESLSDMEEIEGSASEAEAAPLAATDDDSDEPPKLVDASNAALEQAIQANLRKRKALALNEQSTGNASGKVSGLASKVDPSQSESGSDAHCNLTDGMLDTEEDSDNEDEPAAEMALPLKFQAVIAQLLLESTQAQPVRLTELKMPQAEDAVQFATFLWQQGYISTL